ncbi:YgaP family membrane protein [Xanthobacter sp. TB0139]|uniref:YgaP family membrane protein n=1 Tax=Xanthobacter sp. TB0139 TaxID=3459178 RepID=UPI00403A3268
MTANVGGADRVLRFIVGIILLLVPFVGASIIPALAGIGGWAWVIGAVGLVMLLTAIFRFCPAYSLVGINSCARK